MTNSPIFIVSTGRAGSKMLAKTLAIHNELFAIHEPSPNLNIEAYVHWKGTHSEDKIRESIRKKRSPLITQTKDNNLIYLESSHYCSHLIKELMALYDARFIHLFRDGRDFVRSGLERNWYRSKSNILKDPVNFTSDRIKRYIRRRYLLNIGNTFEEHRLIPPINFTTRVQKITWLWVEINSIIISDLKKYRPDYISIKLEEFNSDSIRKILRFINVDFSEKVIQKMINISNNKPNKTKEQTIEDFTNWPDKNKYEFYEIASKMMRKLGYHIQS